MSLLFFLLSVALADEPESPTACASVVVPTTTDVSPQALARNSVVLPAGWAPVAALPDPSATVLVACHATAGAYVFVSGGVREDGALTYRNGLTVSQAVVRAGGFTEYARPRQAYVRRGGEVMRVNLRRVRAGKAADVVLRPDDEVVVPANGT